MMNLPRAAAILLTVFVLILWTSPAACQWDFEEPPPPEQTADTLQDTIQPPAEPVVDENALYRAALREAEAAALEQSSIWLRRLLFRSWVDNTQIGAYAEYQLTDWRENSGSYGAVLARMTIYYLAGVSWLGEDAEWFQVSWRTLDEHPVTVEYDLIVPAGEKITNVYRVLYRINRSEIRAGKLDPPEDGLDYETVDKPVIVREEDVRLYSGTYSTQVYKGSGTSGAVVLAYRSETVKPLGLVILGYGSQALTFTSGGSDAEPRFDVPPPPGQ